MQRSVALGLILIASLPLGCKAPASGDTDTEASTSTGTSSGSTSITTVNPATEVDPTTTASSTSTGPDVPGTSSSGEPVTTTSGTTTATTGATDEGGSNCVPLECDGAIYACGDCMDNDGDGKFDGADPECVSPCDDREDTFATGLPGDNMDPCKQDCFFDGNSGGGMGDCAWNLACDPKSPGGDKCPYNPDQMNCEEMQPDECVMNCQVPNGCDCFGCCTIEVNGMSYDVFLGDPDCSLAEIESCAECTPNDDCDEECHPEDCEICFGQDLPEGCDDPTCDVGETPCEVDDMGGSNCAEGEFCNTGCCAPIMPG
jgi:hypothetical protein